MWQTSCWSFYGSWKLCPYSDVYRIAQHSNYLFAVKLHNSMEQQASNTDTNWNCKVKLPSFPKFSLRSGNDRDRDRTRSNVIKFDLLIMKWPWYRLWGWTKRTWLLMNFGNKWQSKEIIFERTSRFRTKMIKNGELKR